MLINYQIANIIVFLMAHFLIVSSKPLPTIDTLDQMDALDYAPHPNEILSIQPVLLYPLPQNSPLEGRELDDADDDSEIIYVKLLRRKAYRPIRQNSNELSDYNNVPSRELTTEDIFYVKALTNGKFNQHRIKLYRLPEFYAISVYHKGAKH